MSWSTKTLGAAGEKLAELYLRRQGYAIVERNFRCRLGEVDLIAIHRRHIVFIEVKTRSSLYGSPFDAVDRRKQRRLARIALYYLRIKKLTHRPARFDVVGITWAGAVPRIRLIANAFESYR